MINRIVLVGRLVADPEFRTTQTGISVASMRLAVDRAFKDKDGNRQTDFINLVAWRRLAEVCRDYMTKGKLVAVDGSLQSRTFQDKEGNNRTVYEVLADNMQMLDSRGSGGGQGGGYTPPPDDNSAPFQRPPQNGFDPGMDPALNDDLPF